MSINLNHINDQTALNALNEGIQLQKEEQFDVALKKFQYALEIEPNQRPAIYKKFGDLLQKQKQYEEAITAYQKAIELKPNNPALYNVLGDVYHKVGQLNEAITAYQKFIELKGDNPRAYKKLGDALKKSGQILEAIVTYQQSIQLNPNNAKFYSALGDAYSLINNPVEAVASYQKSLELNYNLQGVHKKVAKALNWKLANFFENLSSQSQKNFNNTKTIFTAYELSLNNNETSLNTFKLSPENYFYRKKPNNFSDFETDVKNQLVFQGKWMQDGYLNLSNSTIINDGILLTRNQKILQDSVESSLPKNLRLRGKYKQGIHDNFVIFEPAYVFQRRGTYNYYHWMIEMLPKLYHYFNFLSKSNVKCYIFLNKKSETFIQNSIQFYLSSIGKTSKIDDYFTFLYAPYGIFRNLSYPLFANSYSKGEVQSTRWSQSTLLFYSQLREYIFNLDLNNNYYKRIYVSRKDAKKRKLLNEDQLESSLEKFGFKTVVPGSLSFLEQVKIFANAELIIGCHGANLTNILFAKPGTTVIEIIPKPLINRLRCYWDIASFFNLEYYVIVNSKPNKTGDTTGEKNLEVDVLKIEHLLRNIGLRKR